MPAAVAQGLRTRIPVGNKQANPTNDDAATKKETIHDTAMIEESALWIGEACFCIFVVISLILSLVHKNGTSSAGDLGQLVVTVGCCVYSRNMVRVSALYRDNSSHGLLVGCLSVPVAIAGMMLITPGQSELLVFYLRLSTSCSQIILLEAVFGNGSWRLGESFNVMIALPTALLGAATLIRFPEVSGLVPLAVLALHQVLNRALLRGLPRSFTLGEAAVISTALTLVGTDTAALFVRDVLGINSPLARNLLPVDIVVQCLVVGTVISAATLWPWVQENPICVNESRRHGAHAEKVEKPQTPSLTSKQQDARGFRFSLMLGFVVGFVCMPVATVLLKEHMMIWVANHVQESAARILLMTYWVFVLVSAMVALAAFSTKTVKVPNIVVRKSFHLLALLLFAPGQYFEPQTMRLAYAASFALLVVLEMVRAAKLGSLSNALQSLVDRHIDERDSGKFVLTHIYLLVGCAVPSLLSAGREGRGGLTEGLLPHAGALILGVGDTAASVCGTFFGRVRWVRGAHHGKTVEGTLAGWVFTTAAALLFPAMLGRLASVRECVLIVGATCGACLLEALTDQIDNLILPLWYFAMLSLAARA